MSEKKIKIFITIAAIIFVGIILIFVVYNNTDKSNEYIAKKEEEGKNDDRYTRYKGIIVDIDDSKKVYTVRDYNNINQVEFEYKPGCEIKNRYGKDIYYDKLKIGDVVIVGYDKKISNLKYIYIDDSIVNFSELKKYTLNTDTYYIELDDTKYRLTKETFVYGAGKEYTMYDINENDVLTLNIKNNDIISVVIEKGHSKVSLRNYDSFIGYNLVVNDEKAYEIKKGFEIDVPEGKNTFTIKNDKLTGSVTLNIVSGYDREIDVKNINFEKKKEGKVKFYIEPNNARLYISGKSYNYDEEILLDYGKYKYVVESAGYSAHSAMLNVESDSVTVSVHLYENKQTEEPNNTNNTNNEESATATATATTTPTAKAED